MDELSTCVYILKICPDYETKRYKHQFKTEINVLSNLNSIHVPSLITCFEEDFAQCFVETYIPGINARQYFQNHRCLFKKYRLLIDVLKVLQDFCRKFGCQLIEFRTDMEIANNFKIF